MVEASGDSDKGRILHGFGDQLSLKPQVARSFFIE